MVRDWEIWDTPGHADFLTRLWGSPSQQKGRHWELLLAVSDLVEGDSVLDVACGMGHLYTLIKRKKPNIKYLGIDNSQDMIRKAREFFPEEKHCFQVGDAYNLSNLPDFDTVVAVSLFLHLPETEPVLKQMWSKAKRCALFTTYLDVKPSIIKKEFSGQTPIPKPKYLISRVESISNLFLIFSRLEGLGKIERFHFDARDEFFKLSKNGRGYDYTRIFRLTKGIPRYGSFRTGWTHGV